jgi:hypothetical protein
MRHLRQAAAQCGELIVDTGNIGVIDRQKLMREDRLLAKRTFGHLLQLPGSSTVLPGGVVMDSLLALKFLRRGSRRRS